VRASPTVARPIEPDKEQRMSERPNIVLVHGAWADGSSWSAVIEPLQARGYTVTAPQFPETSLADDVARLRHVLGQQTGPTVVAAHSYGGHIVTSLGADAPNVVALVYVAAFGLDEGESLGALLGGGPPTPSLANLIDVMGEPAWKSHPSWYLVAANDEAIPPDAERQFAQRMGATTVEVEAGHLAMLSHADDVVTLIEAACEAVAEPLGDTSPH
jgi:pimeloyl-ACP methyl ester carboxylesterase